MEIKFIIYGNQEDPRGNPIPKIKKTRWQRWTHDAQRYAEWKKYVQAAFLDAVARSHPEMVQQVGQCMVRAGKPIELGTFQRAYMILQIHWKNGAHGDSENVFGSVADALFVNDKKLDGAFMGRRSWQGKGRIEVSVHIVEAAE